MYFTKVSYLNADLSSQTPHLMPGLGARGRLVRVRGLASVDVETRRLGYSEYGDPARVVSLVTERMQAELRPGQVQRLDNM